MGLLGYLPCGKLILLAMENGAFIEDLALKMVIFYSYVKSPEGTTTSTNCIVSLPCLYISCVTPEKPGLTVGELRLAKGRKLWERL